MSPVTIIKNFFGVAKGKGLVTACQMLAGRAYTRYKERSLGIKTDAVVFLPELGFTNSDCSEYGATPYGNFTTMMQKLKVVPEEHVFLDYGAGMGRAVVLAALLPFKRVIGVELSEELTGVANENIQSSRSKLVCKDVSMICEDATTYQPTSDITLFYFNNPFAGDILEKVLQNIREMPPAPKPRILLCNLPRNSRFEAQVRAKEWLRLSQDYRMSESRWCLVFEVQ
jgi:16S rRNA G966 N2-methylase RsmD